MANNLNVILAVYGTPGFPSEGDMLTRTAAEHFAEQLKGKLIDNPAHPGAAKQLMIVEASLEGNEKQGQIVAECMEVQDSVSLSDAL